MTESLPIAIIGAGPVGLAAAAHLIERGGTPIVFEAGDQIGASIRAWAHVRMFSPWEYVVDRAALRLLNASGWELPNKDGLPTGGELVEQYLRPLAALPAMRDHIRTGARVLAVSRRHIDKMKDAGRGEAPFVLHIAYADGREEHIAARAVIDASGTWTQPNPLGADGLPALGERRAAERIAYGIPDVRGTAQGRYANKRVAVIGSGHSAINVLLELAALQTDAPATTITWVLRGTNMARVYGGGTDDGLPARAQLGTRTAALIDSGAVEMCAPFRAHTVAMHADHLALIGATPDGDQTLIVDEIIVATGARPDLDVLRELRLDLDPALESVRALAPLIDPNVHSCGTVPPHGEAELRQPERDFYIIGMKSYGRAPTFLLLTGYEQARSVTAALMGDWAAARDVQLVLPETGVCSSEDGSCCAPPFGASSGVIALDGIDVGLIRLDNIDFRAPVPSGD